MPWHSLRLQLISSPPEPNLDALTAASCDAIVLQCAGSLGAVASIAAARPDLPLIVLADVSQDVSLRLVAAGADDVLPRDAAMPDIMAAVQQAVAQKQLDQEAWIEVGKGSGDAHSLPPQLEAIGRLAGGIAQDFNNLLLVVDGNAERLLAGLAADDPLRDRAAAIAAATRRGVVLTQKLLAFGRQQPLAPIPLDVNAIVTDCAPLVRRALGSTIRLMVELTPDLPQVRVDRLQMVQVLSSLARTAAGAMPDGGVFTITTDTVVVDADMRRPRPWLASGQFVRLQVADSGPGIEEHSLPHVFEPFFSTGTSRGSGLDLPSVYGVVKQNGGFIWVDSQVGHGTRVTILLPQLQSATALDDVPSEVPRVLLVEDDDEVRALLIDVLRSHGVDVTSVASAEEALELEQTQPFDLLLTDIGLPGLDGRELARVIRHRSPRLPVLFISGQSGEVLDAEAALALPHGFLQKPFSSRALVASLHELLQVRGRDAT